jgi:hypothetical protein
MIYLSEGDNSGPQHGNTKHKTQNGFGTTWQKKEIVIDFSNQEVL